MARASGASSQDQRDTDTGPHTRAEMHRWRLLVAFGFIASFFVVELVLGLLTGSLALISDAGHMAADMVALGAALVATKIASRPDATGRRTYASYRAEIFASGFTVLLMLGCRPTWWARPSRYGDEVDVETGPMLVVGALGLLVNLVALALQVRESTVSLYPRTRCKPWRSIAECVPCPSTPR